MLPAERAALANLFTSVVRINPVGFSDIGAWHRWLEQEKPEVLVTCWKTPTLPEDPKHPGLSELKYLCHLTGTVRKLVPRALIAVSYTHLRAHET